MGLVIAVDDRGGNWRKGAKAMSQDCAEGKMLLIVWLACSEPRPCSISSARLNNESILQAVSKTILS